ncbi:MAG: prepilin-type N-terminal cleavage/methylation domain-containing protein [Candidatus Saccharimonas sp.]
MSKQQLKERGFTIIEVVLVLAIAALIFLMVFVALPALQRSQRDMARKNDADTIASAAQQILSNNKGDASKVTTANIQSYIGSGNDSSLSNLSKDQITAQKYSNTVTVTAQTLVENGGAIVVVGGKCGDSATTSTITKGSSKSIVVAIGVEAGGTPVTYCVGS